MMKQNCKCRIEKIIYYVLNNCTINEKNDYIIKGITSLKSKKLILE